MNTKNWKDRELNRLLMERFGYSMSEGGCEQVHPGMTHEQYLEENELQEVGCGSGYNRDEELEEELVGDQKEIDADSDGEITADDFEILRKR
jgi:hypothetical protein